jgi:hypothetical protein
MVFLSCYVDKRICTDAAKREKSILLTKTVPAVLYCMYSMNSGRNSQSKKCMDFAA